MIAIAPRPEITKRLKYVVSLGRSRVEGAADDRPYIGLENIESSTGRLIGEPAATDDSALPASGESESMSNSFEPGDVLFGKLRPYLAKAWVAAFPGRCTTELLVMQPVGAESRFLRYVCLSRDFIDAVDASTFGSKMPRADWNFIGNMLIPVPPRPQQRAIADYLDHETARLDALVAAKERVLGLLAEKRRALITRAVTRGLDPHVPLRDFGIPWLGEIPVHWGVAQLKRAAAVIDCKHRTVPFVEGGVPLASIREVQSWEVDLRAAKMTTEDEYLLMIEGERDPRHGDVIVSRNATVGAAALVAYGIRFCMGQDVSLVRPKDVLESSFLNWLFRSDVLVNQVVASSIGSTFFRINVEQIKELVIPLPDAGEQRAIVAHIAKETAKLDELRIATERTISLLKERRAALIAAAVTGHIDVDDRRRSVG